MPQQGGGGGAAVPEPSGPPPGAAVAPPVRVAVRDGVLHILPGSPERPALLHPGPGVLLRVNGEVVQRAAAVRPGDRVEVEVLPPEDPAARGGFRVEVAPDRMQALLRVIPARERVLKDAPPSRVLTLEARERPVPPAGIAVESVLAALAEAGVRHGVDRDAIAQALAQPPRVPVVVARGRPPRQGPDGAVVAQGAMAADPEPAPDDGRVDFRARPPVPSVNAGDVVARVQPPGAGVEGVDVTGAPVAAPPGRPAHVRCGEGVERRAAPDGGEEIVARVTGRPVVERLGAASWRVDVVPLFVHPGDVDVASGDVRFRGDVWVAGSVREGARVVCGGHAWVEGDVDGGWVVANGDVRVGGGAFRAHLVAGARHLSSRRVAPALAALAGRLEQLEEAMAMVQQAASFRMEDLRRLGPGRLARLLVEFKFTDLPRLAEAVVRARREDVEAAESWDPRWAELEGPLQAMAAGEVPDGLDAAALARAVRAAAEAAAAEAGRPAGRVRVGYVHNSVVRGGHSVAVGSRGAYYARIEAGERVDVQGPVIGGTVEAGTAIRVLEAGAAASPATALQVGPHGSIAAGRVHANVWLRVGGRSYRLTRSLRRVHATGESLEAEEA